MTDNHWGSITGIRPVKIVRNMISEGLSDAEILNSFTTVQGVSEKKALLSLNIAHLELDILKNIKENDICIYIGVPFCKTKCLYCSFVTDSASSCSHLIQPFVDSLVKEMEYTSKLVDKLGFRVVSIYIGGGTPTTLSPTQLETVITACNRYFDTSSVSEITVEAGRPDTIDEEKLIALKKLNVSRISINPQTMNDKTLQLIGRRHSADEIYKSFELARRCGFDNINMDVIAGLPGETTEDFIYTINEVERLSPESTTVHTMSIKRGSKLFQTLSLYDLTKSEAVCDMIDYSSEYLTKNGKNPYYLYRQKNILGNLENVGYAKNGFECLYNIMMMEETSTIVSLGCGAVTKMVLNGGERIERIFNVKEVTDYVNRIDEMCTRKDKMLIF